MTFAKRLKRKKEERKSVSSCVVRQKENQRKNKKEIWFEWKIIDPLKTCVNFFAGLGVWTHNLLLSAKGRGRKVVFTSSRPLYGSHWPLVGYRGLWQLLIPSLRSSNDDPRACTSIRVAVQLLHLKSCVARTSWLCKLIKWDVELWPQIKAELRKFLFSSVMGKKFRPLDCGFVTGGRSGKTELLRHRAINNDYHWSGLKLQLAKVTLNWYFIVRKTRHSWIVQHTSNSFKFVSSRSNY